MENDIGSKKDKNPIMFSYFIVYIGDSYRLLEQPLD
jgi:hypothetical protein